ncbi:hypothetical protein FOTG_18108 [Fusarium oxysporum f. sp. vasinfectum 25433]|uniref:Uncharacterized protein n=1 Tax=Fusarium oxysporum f. sp. vasinfectum 25433 TaxID=1089449 RepID=X0LY98_FUSOX|nr:hypothetical protein FOTG_18108 [Fusarium oxysporum f. sp. vasinfectum 25433]
MNNDVARRALYDSEGRPLRGFSKRHQIIRKLDPKPGEVCTMYWGEPHNRDFAILILPWDNYHSFGWDMIMKDTGL